MPSRAPARFRTRGIRRLRCLRRQPSEGIRNDDDPFIDGHVHIYPFHNAQSAVTAGIRNLRRVAGREGDTVMAWCSRNVMTVTSSIQPGR